MSRDGRVDPDADRLVEGADQVLGARVVDADLAADGAIDHRQQRRRHHQQRQAAVVGRRHEAGQVADDAAADRDDQRFAVGLQLGEAVVEPGRRCQTFLRLTGRNRHQGGAEIVRRQRGFHAAAMDRCVFVRDDQGSCATDEERREGTDSRAVAAGNGDLVTSFTE